MRFARSAIAAGLATAATVMASDASSSSDVLVLGQANFTENVNPEVCIKQGAACFPVAARVELFSDTANS